METFDWLPNQGIDIEEDQQLREVQFGGGIMQVQPKYLCRPKRKFTLTFEGRPQRIKAIFDFLSRQRGKRFLWQFEGETLKVRCMEYKRNYTGIVDTLDCTFNEEWM
ncbi:phage tail protein [Neisseria leonii]|uniref:Phage tail protein n=1 Tax=Neisseria leonii TaxID=2995413 RepID=A0A9X4DZM5_9NEIS|nr:phage tail protein [Neisseria sp. 51.81]MDD9326752.1 phage tail protein [Neisseria sp. 51.81]